MRLCVRVISESTGASFHTSLTAISASHVAQTGSRPAFGDVTPTIGDVRASSGAGGGGGGAAWWWYAGAASGGCLVAALLARAAVSRWRGAPRTLRRYRLTDEDNDDDGDKMGPAAAAAAGRGGSVFYATEYCAQLSKYLVDQDSQQSSQSSGAPAETERSSSYSGASADSIV